jgi:hypothetical protein
METNYPGTKIIKIQPLGKSDWILATGNWQKIAIWNYEDYSIAPKYFDIDYSRISQINIMPGNRHLVIATENAIKLQYLDILSCTDPLATDCSIQNADWSITCVTNAEIKTFDVNGENFQRCFCVSGYQYDFLSQTCVEAPDSLCKDELASTCSGTEYVDTLTCVQRATLDQLTNRCRC